MPTCSAYRLLYRQRAVPSSPYHPSSAHGVVDSYARYATVKEGSLLKCSDSMKRSSRFQLMEAVASEFRRRGAVVRDYRSSSAGHGNAVCGHETALFRRGGSG